MRTTYFFSILDAVIGTVHLLVGAMIGTVLIDPPSVFIVALFSHYLLDYLPHIDPETFTDRLSFTWRQTTVLILDTVSTVLFALIFYLNHDRWALILLGGLAAQLPDLMIPLQKYEWFAPLRRNKRKKAHKHTLTTESVVINLHKPLAVDTLQA